MSMTLIISEGLENRLKEKAVRNGKDPNALAEELLSDALAWDDADREDMDAGIERGFAAFDAGRFRPFSEFVEEQKRKYGL